MTILSMVSGSLHKDPEKKSTKAGAPFVCCTVKHLDGGHAQFVRVVAFDPDAAAELAGLARGDGLTVSGRLEAEAYQKDDAPARVSLSIVAERVEALKKTRREKIATAKKEDQNGMLRRY